jgi:hypothetical protein
MGLGGISVWQLVIVLIIFVVTLIAAPIRRAGKRQGHSGEDCGQLSLPAEASRSRALSAAIS